ncbi:MAG: ABC transporter ATP-binding protein, partial [Planctomycetales bacterium]|nr:ABC transporter ATP-binding protein [Planctomycetales bacterium]
ILLEQPFPAHWQNVGSWLMADKLRSIALVSSTIILIAIIKGTGVYLQTYFMSRVGYEMVYRLRRELFNHLQTLSLSFHSRTHSGELLTKVTTDTKALRNLFGSAALSFPSYLAVLIGMSLVMLWVNLTLSVAVLATLPPLSYFLFRRLSILKNAARRERRNEGRMASRVNDALSSMTLLQAFGREKFESERFDVENTQALQQSVVTAQTEASAERAVEIVSAVGQFLVVILGSMQVLRGRLTPGELLVFSSYVTKVFKPVDNLVKLLAKLTAASVSVQRIGEILEVDPDLRELPTAIDAINLRGEIEYAGVSFDYGEGRNVISDASFRIAPGERVALVGASGAGKSTLVALLPRLFDPTQGVIRVDGRDIRDYRCQSLRDQIGIVLQEQFITGVSIRDNISYGNLSASDAEVVAAAKAAHAHDFITQLDEGYDTVLGERGVTLSGGQRQRLALARAFIRQSPILILDEPMTGLDAHSEALVRDALARLMKHRTCLVITHALDLAVTADKVLMLEGGTIVEQGTHAELIALNGAYARLCARSGMTPRKNSLLTMETR